MKNEETKLDISQILRNSLDKPDDCVQVEIEVTTSKINNLFNDFGVKGTVNKVSEGPRYTRYCFVPASGVKISKIFALEQDIALRFNSPVGFQFSQSYDGINIDIPQKETRLISLKEVLLSEEFNRKLNSCEIAVPFGISIDGHICCYDLKDLGNLLISGTTGSGKSNFLKCILTGILLNYSPMVIRLFLIDTRILELQTFQGVPHLRTPVIHKKDEVLDALNWVFSELERRQRLLSAFGVENFDKYKSKVEKTELMEIGDLLPRLLVIIDDLSDFMIPRQPEILSRIHEVACQANPLGIHLIIATQRSASEVITSDIKQSFTSKFALKTSSESDSRIILDTAGAEKLFKSGDGLLKTPSNPLIQRIHCAYVTDEDIRNTLVAVRNHYQELTEETIYQTADTQKTCEDMDDPLYCDAVNLVLKSGVASVSMLQRRLKVGQSRALRLIESMEQNRIIGPHIGSKVRDILVDPDEFPSRLEDAELSTDSIARDQNTEKTPKQTSDCFIASACLEENDEENLAMLRNWRDGSLSWRFTGRLFIQLYKKLGPILATAISPFPWLKRVIRKSLILPLCSILKKVEKRKRLGNHHRQ